MGGNMGQKIVSIKLVIVGIGAWIGDVFGVMWQSIEISLIQLERRLSRENILLARSFLMNIYYVSITIVIKKQ